MMQLHEIRISRILWYALISSWSHLLGECCHYFIDAKNKTNIK